jgi:hypothetical protein
MNEGEAIGLLIGIVEAPDPERPLLLQHWDWAETVVEAIDESRDDPALRAMVVQAVTVILDLPESDPQEAWHEVVRRRGFNEIRKGARRG